MCTADGPPQSVPFSCHGKMCAAGNAIFVSRQDVRRGQCDFRVTAKCTPRAMRFPCHSKMYAAGGSQTYRRPVGLCGVPAAERLHSKCLPSQSSSFRHFEPLRGPFYPSRSPYHCENSPKSYKTLVTSQFIAVFMEIKTVSTTKCPEKAINLHKPPNL